ncbi:hypothetical protein BU24DRAFT_409721 [Aaosphaeria arxii CBS 175.79]|uniref:Uncharacterized protein n=1 Tax=Aaosphaeria arxii CBS 175.79 TaxID=1450172 RepID=A0A6A5XUK7_9PLEO|nr:uncharacterized protein BU24DRAFT_409721 [Aaosphaeria arxii CBS 175.79]KAF2016633.1 hypothetical protein BU24DRAFT_409721 [Aaosphaeria arxii CBS 175.79]
MCIILPVDHIVCTHTVAVWQHCINAPRSKAYGLKPCGKIRQHSRPIVTRKKCPHCGGPRFFARRGGLAERGRGSPEPLTSVEEKEERRSMDEDSGYHSEAIIEEDEDVTDDDIPISPKASAVHLRDLRWQQRQYREAEAKLSERRQSHDRVMSPTRRSRPTWRPSLRKEPSEEALSFSRSQQEHYSSVGLALESTITNQTHLPALDTAPTEGIKVVRRKNSTLLHPSSPDQCEPITPPRTPDPWFSAPRPAFAFPISSQLKPQNPPPLTRKDSTLLHPSNPDSEPEHFSSDATAIALTTEAAVPLPAPKRPEFVRKSSTLLHPSSPQSPPLSPGDEEEEEQEVLCNNMAKCDILTPPPSSDSCEFQSTFFHRPTQAKPLFVFPHNLIPRNSSSFQYSQARRRSILHSSLSDTEE